MRRKPSAVGCVGCTLIWIGLILAAWTISGCGTPAQPQVPAAIPRVAGWPHDDLARRVGTGVGSGAPCLPFACTSFAVYSDGTLYGMNFDYPDVELRFTINTVAGLKVFQMEFWQEGGFVPTVGTNSAGLFSSCQMLFPETPMTTSPGTNEVYPWQVYQESLLHLDSVEEVVEFIDDKRIVHWALTLHNLFADAHGDAMVVEAGDEENVITEIEGDFIVMTNFPNGDFAGQSYEDVEGVGADRYKIAVEHISEHLAAFDLDRGLETLEKAVLSGEWSTQCSMVFDPEESEVYIALKGDFSRIWKVSIADRTVETFVGFDRAEKAQLDSSGVTASDLQGMGASHGMHWSYSVIGLLLVLIGGGVYLFVIRKRSGAQRQGVSGGRCP